MRIVLGILLVVLVLGQGLVRTVIVARFLQQQQDITARLCEQKDEVENTCQGHCYLNKQLEKADVPATPPAKSLKEIAPEMLADEPLRFAFSAALLPEVALPRHDFMPYLRHYRGVAPGVFAPPPELG